MATVKTCDRCGKMIKFTIDAQLVTLIHTGPYFLSASTAKDLCTECMLELREWLRPKEEHNA